MKNIILITLLFTTWIVSGQDIHFSQFTMTPLQLDPSQAGKMGGDLRAILNYKDQWGSISNPYKTYGFSFDMRLNKKQKKDNFFGIGISAYNDNAGDINMGLLEMNLSLAYHIKLIRSSYLSAGIQGGFGQKSLDPTALRYDNQYDGYGHNPAYSSNESITTPSFMYPDFSVGVSFSSGNNSNRVRSNNGYDGRKINVGLAVHHAPFINNSYLGDKLQMQNLKYVLHTITSFGIENTRVAIQPSGFIAYQNGATEFTLGSYFRYTLQEQSRFTKFVSGSAFNLGLHYRTEDALIVTALLEIGSFALGTSYDFNVSGLTVASHGRGGLEISLRYISPNPFGLRKSQSSFF
jgi:type IX secretion system PorP/SprF family membrane protein